MPRYIDAYVKKGYVELKKKYVPDTNAPTKVSSGEIVKDPEHRCLYCQEIIPQGIDVCPKCEKERG